MLHSETQAFWDASDRANVFIGIFTRERAVAARTGPRTAARIGRLRATCVQACMAGMPTMLAQPVVAPRPTQPTQQQQFGLLPDGGRLLGR